MNMRGLTGSGLPQSRMHLGRKLPESHPTPRCTGRVFQVRIYNGTLTVLLAGVYWELSKMNRKFIISHSVTGTILYYPRPLLRRNSSKLTGLSSQACHTVSNGD